MLAVNLDTLTTIDMLLGLARPDSGTVGVYGKTASAAVTRGEVSAVMQSGGLLKDYVLHPDVSNIFCYLFGILGGGRRGGPEVLTAVQYLITVFDHSI